MASQQNELDHANDLLLNTKKNSSADNSQFDISQLSSTAVTVGGGYTSLNLTTKQVHKPLKYCKEELDDLHTAV